MRIGRRSGISNLIGTVFFVLVVALVVATFAGLFTTFGTYLQGSHASHQTAMVEKESSVGVKGVAFGGVLNASAATGVTWNQNRAPDQVPLKPLTNMNFTGGMAGWSTTKTYSLPVDSAAITNVNTTNKVIPNMTEFELAVTNDDPPTSGKVFARVTLLVDQAFTDVSIPAAPSCSQPPDFLSAPVVGNNLTWYAKPYSDGEPPGDFCDFFWMANVTATAPATYYHTVIVTWYTTSGHLVGDGAAAVSTVVTTGAGGKLRLNGTSAAQITPVSQANEPTGLTLGYDPSPVDGSALSGTGSFFSQFQPMLNSMSLASDQQVSTSVNLTTTFMLNKSMAAQISATNCCTFTMETDLEKASAAPNPLVFYRVYLVNDGVGCLPRAPFPYCEINRNGTNPTLGNDFGTTGWTLATYDFNPSSSFWTAGRYTLTVITNMTVLGSSNATAGYFPDVEMRFDDIGLSFLPSSSTPSYYAENQYTWHLPTDEVQQIALGANVTLAPQQSVAYLQAQDDTSGTPEWTTLQTVFLQNATSAQFQANITSDQASFFVNKAQDLTMRVVLVTFTAPSPSAPLPVFQAYSTVSTADVQQVVVTLDDASPQPVNLTAIYVSGPGPTAGFILDTFLHHTVWIGSGTMYEVQLPLQWEPGQVYTFTVVAAQGVVYSESFAAP